MKRISVLIIGLVIGISALLAENEPVYNRYGENVGNVEWSYDIQTFESRAGSFTTIYATNNSKEWVKVSFKTDAGGFESLNIPPHESRKVTLGTDKTATRVYLLNIHVD